MHLEGAEHKLSLSGPFYPTTESHVHPQRQASVRASVCACVCVCVCVCMHARTRRVRGGKYLQRLEESICSPGAGVTEGYEQRDVDAETQTPPEAALTAELALQSAYSVLF